MSPSAASLVWPGAHRAGDVGTDAALLRALVAVEAAWLDALAAAGAAPVDGAGLTGLVGDDDLPALAAAAEDGGTPVTALLPLLRSRARAAGLDAAADWLHRGLTSQDVLDTALLRCAADAVAALRPELDAQVAALAALVDAHRATPLVARTLTQHALPTTVGLRAAGWLTGLLDARDAVAALVLPAQLGGAVGTLAATVDLLRRTGSDDPARDALGIAADAARRLGLAPRPPWHTSRRPVTALGDALVTLTDAYGHLAGDVLQGSRPEAGELREGAAAGRGGSSAMPQKRNPVLAVLLRRTASSTPGLAAQLHAAAAGAVDERPDGAWHTEWPALTTLLRAALAAARQATELVTGLEVDAAAAARNLDAALPGALAERLVPALGRERATAVLALPDVVAARAALAADERHLLDPADYLGAADLLVDAVLDRARTPLP